MKSTSLALVFLLLLGCSSTTHTRLSAEADAFFGPVAASDAGTEWSVAADGAVIKVSVPHLDADAAPVLPEEEEDGGVPPDSTPIDPLDPLACSAGQKWCVFEGCVESGGDYGCNVECDPCPPVYYGKSICDGDQCSAECDAGFEPAPKLPAGNITCRQELPDGCTEAWVDDCNGFGSECPSGIFRGFGCTRKADVGTNSLWCC